ncbi:MAG: hypothetical protein LBC74_05150 [Planctomycetaceae bacterium]|nr:hypothetical protein [Planctomycetaceae bacterium]
MLCLLLYGQLWQPLHEAPCEEFVPNTYLKYTPIAIAAIIATIIPNIGNSPICRNRPNLRLCGFLQLSVTCRTETKNTKSIETLKLPNLQRTEKLPELSLQ